MAPVIIVLLFGIIEFGTMFKDVLAINEAAREGARSAAVGNPTATITTRVDASVPTLDSTQLTTTYQYRTLTSGTWSSWSTLTDSSGLNAAPSGAQIRSPFHTRIRWLRVACFHSSRDPGKTYVTLSTSMVVRRE